MTHELGYSTVPRLLLQCEFSQSQENDLALVAQFELWSITTQVFDKFGADIERHSSTFAEELRAFESAYDTWLKDWMPVLSPLAHLLTPAFIDGNHHFASQTFHISLLSAKLYLFSHVFRGPAQRQHQPPIIAINTTELQHFAQKAIKCALQIIKAVTNLAESGFPLQAVPSYLGIMTAFASMILHRTAQAQHKYLTDVSGKPEVRDDLRKLCDMLQESLLPSGTGADVSYSSTIPLVGLAHALKTLNTCDNLNDDDPLRDSRPGTYMSTSMATDEMHFHSAYIPIDADIFTTDYANMDFTFLDGDNLDWLSAGGRSSMPGSGETAGVNADGP